MMEKKGLRKKDMLRMDGLLPPTRRLPVCDAVSGTSAKKKDRKWSIGGILRRISSIRDYDSSSNDEEIVYCKRTPRKLTKLNRQTNDVVLQSIENNPEQDNRGVKIENSTRRSTGSPSQLRRDSLHSRSSDGSLDGSGKKIRKNKLKARAEAKRDHLRADSSSDEDCRRSNGSLNRFHAADGAYNGQRSNVCNRKTRAARTERYIKRLSRDDGNGDTSNEPPNKRCSSEHTAEDEQQQQQRVVYADMNGSCRPPVHPRRAISVASPQNSPNTRALPPQRSSVESLRINADCVGLPDPEIVSFNDCRRYSSGQYVTDMNQNNTYAKISRNISTEAYVDNRQGGNFFTYPAKNIGYYPEPFERVAERRLLSQDSRPPEPPPRDPRYRALSHGYNSYPTNRHQNASSCYERRYGEAANAANELSRPDWRHFRSYGSNNEIARQCDTVQLKYSATSTPKMEICNSLEYMNNKYNSSRHCTNNELYKETELTRCRRRNIRNEQLSRNDANSSAYIPQGQSAKICESSKKETVPSYVTAMWTDRLSRRSPCEHVTATCDADRNDIEKSHGEGNSETTLAEEASERRRSSRNLEEALCELEAIYNSLRLGDEDLLDRAERRSMEEFSLRQGRSELDAMAATNSPDSPDRTKDDMAYRRMHPKERPTSLSDIAGQSTLSNISYLVASPVLSRREEDLKRVSSVYSVGRRDEPDVTRDDMVFRSINRANNTPKVIDPQPPFGIPLGPVTAATESDYLHTTPTKPEQPRSPYIPQCEPDVVTDDLAYRALRKDAGAARNGAESVRKKRAVRSLSANLYGLINHDRIHLRREPSLDAIKDEIQDAARNSVATSERTPYLRRVVSDGELSDNDRRKEPARGGGTDINGNHPTVGAYRKKLSRVYISPETSTTTTTTTTRESPKKEPSIAEISDAMLTSKAALGDEFWHEYLRPDSNASNANSSHSTEADFSAYSRLCQDLVNLIKGDEPEPAGQTIVAVAPADNKPDEDTKHETDELSTGSSARSLDNHCSEHCQRAVHIDGKHNAGENVESPAAFSTNSTEPESETTTTSNLDFYLRVADENVKLIAAAFGSVADHLRDSRLSARKNSSTSRDVSEIENQSGSTRSSTLYSPDDAYDDRLRPTVVVSPRPEETRAISKRDSWTSNEGDQAVNSDYFEQDVCTADVELDLSRAVRDLQLAAASLYEHEREIEDLGVARDKKIDVHDTQATIVSNTNKREDSPIRKINLIADALRKEQEHQEEEEEEEKEARIREATPVTTISTDENEDKNLLRKIIADDLRQERERDQEEVTVLPSGIAEMRRDAREESCEGLHRRSLAQTDDRTEMLVRTADGRRE
ncbi:uncharacterized protein LOC116850677 [Odontomachus brunneus]|uniref:uncharacterized protein LOC116850677 n=1 Tax=Odontomachus brunneus TaxID=486640 RepID=UPI0013F1E68E|nr:uncharacterized protein LOC116850677 [Odontomachus brunneus]XP_032685151.1 uncharacterized protein LOC116850677 [Odontomachus brunneus]XP_032685152.1 uncharacterized protein LOC116850677 [Odontomachus brunneus]